MAFLTYIAGAALYLTVRYPRMPVIKCILLKIIIIMYVTSIKKINECNLV